MRTIRTKTILLLSAACLAGFALTACSTDPEEKTSTGPDSLHVQAATLRTLGDTVFHANCTGCHGDQGEGGSHAPNLANSDFFMNNRQLVINLVLRGNRGPFIDSLVVNGRTFFGGSMPPWHDALTNKEIASALTYLRSVLNDSTVVSCTGGEENVCTKVARSPAAMSKDTVAVWEVKAVRDSLNGKGLLTTP